MKHSEALFQLIIKLGNYDTKLDDSGHYLVATPWSAAGPKPHNAMKKKMSWSQHVFAW